MHILATDTGILPILIFADMLAHKHFSQYLADTDIADIQIAKTYIQFADTNMQKILAN